MAEDTGRVQLIGTGLIGASIGLGLRAAGWYVTGTDHDPSTATAALDRGAVDALGHDPAAELVVVALPVGAVAEAVRAALIAHPAAVVTDVGSVKAAIVAAVDDPRFVGGHPMAGSEQEGVGGASESMFRGAIWVLTPSTTTDPNAYATVRSAVVALGAEVVTLPPDEHDSVVAVISHVPHLTAGTLMRLAANRADGHGAVLRLAAGGFRDMTRIASGHPGIWPDICEENRDAIVAALDELIAEMRAVRDAVATTDRPTLFAQLEAARAARLNLPTTAARAELLAEVRIPVSDEPGQLSTVTSTATDLDVNIYDIELAHSAEGARGVMILVIEQRDVAQFVARLESLGYHSSTRGIG